MSADQLDHLFDQWRTYLGTSGAKLVRDGVIGSEDAWKSLPLRIVFLLKEPHDRNGVLGKCGYDLRGLFRDPHLYSQNKKTVERRIADWAADFYQVVGLAQPEPRNAL